MEEQCDYAMDSERSLSILRSDSKTSTGEKREAFCLEEKCELVHKRVKMRDLGSLFASKENKYFYSKCNKEDGHDLRSSCSEGGAPQVTEVSVTVDSEVIQAERTGRSTFPVDVKPPTRPLDLNAEDCSSALCLPRKEIRENTRTLKKLSQRAESDRERNGECVSSKGIGVDLNAVDGSECMNPDSVNPHKDDAHFSSGDVSECGSSTGPVQEKDPMKIWKEMKQNGYMSSSYGGIPLPKQLGKKSKSGMEKKRIEIAKKEQISRFTKLAAPSGLLNELNPGIINHVRNRKQVHSIIEALVKSAKHGNGNVGIKEGYYSTSGKEDVYKRKDLEHSYDAGLFPQKFSVEKNLSLYPGSKHSREYLSTKQDSSPLFCEGKGSDGEQCVVYRSSTKGYTSLCMDANKEDTLALKLSSLIKSSESSSSLCNEETSNLTGVSSLSAKAATVASRWLELLYQDIKGRLSALQRSKKRVRAVIKTELPFLAVKEFPFNQESDPCVVQNSAALVNDATAGMHQKRWSKLFEQMDNALLEEEKQLESWLAQVRKMQALADQGLQYINGYPNYDGQQNPSSGQVSNKSDKESAVRAAAASIYSTCNFISSNSLTC